MIADVTDEHSAFYVWFKIREDIVNLSASIVCYSSRLIYHWNKFPIKNKHIEFYTNDFVHSTTRRLLCRPKAFWPMIILKEAIEVSFVNLLRNNQARQKILVWLKLLFELQMTPNSPHYYDRLSSLKF